MEDTADMEEIYAALLKAHANGDIESAKTLAAYIEQVEQEEAGASSAPSMPATDVPETIAPKQSAATLATAAPIPDSPFSGKGLSPEATVAMGGQPAADLSSGLMRSVQSTGEGARQLGHIVRLNAPFASEEQRIDAKQNIDRIAAESKANEEAYQARTAGSFLAGAGRFGGEIATFLAPGNAIAKATKIPKLFTASEILNSGAQLAVTGAAQGGASALFAPLQEASDSPTADKAGQIATAGVAGAILNPVVTGAGRGLLAGAKYIDPRNWGANYANWRIDQGGLPMARQIREGVELGDIAGKKLSPGATTGSGVATSLEKAVASSPHTSDMLKASERQTIEAMDKMYSKLKDGVNSGYVSPEMAGDKAMDAIKETVETIRKVRSAAAKKSFDGLRAKPYTSTVDTYKGALRDVIERAEGSNIDDIKKIGLKAREILSNLPKDIIPEDKIIPRKVDYLAGVDVPEQVIKSKPIPVPIDMSKLIDERRALTETIYGKGGLFSDVLDQATRRKYAGDILQALDRDIEIIGEKTGFDVSKMIAASNAEFGAFSKKIGEVRLTPLKRILGPIVSTDEQGNVIARELSGDRAFSKLKSLTEAEHRLAARVIGKQSQQAKDAIARGMLEHIEAISKKEGDIGQEIDWNKLAKNARGIEGKLKHWLTEEQARDLDNVIRYAHRADSHLNVAQSISTSSQANTLTTSPIHAIWLGLLRSIGGKNIIKGITEGGTHYPVNQQITNILSKGKNIEPYIILMPAEKELAGNGDE